MKNHPCLARGLERCARAFVLLEVIVSLTILGVAVAAFMRSFTQSLSAARQLEVKTQAIFFAQQLMDEFEIFPPEEGEKKGGFGDDYASFWYLVTMEYEEPDDPRLEGTEAIEQYFAMRNYTLEIHYEDGIHKPYIAYRISSSIINFEKFSLQSKQSYANY